MQRDVRIVLAAEDSAVPFLRHLNAIDTLEACEGDVVFTQRDNARVKKRKQMIVVADGKRQCVRAVPVPDEAGESAFGQYRDAVSRQDAAELEAGEDTNVQTVQIYSYLKVWRGGGVMPAGRRHSPHDRLLTRRISVLVDEPDPGQFFWILTESTEDATIFGELKAAEGPEQSWVVALNAGVLVLKALATDVASGPRGDVGNEVADAVG